MKAHNVDLDSLEGLGLLTGWDYFVEESLNLQGGPPTRTTTPEAPPSRSPPKDILNPKGTYTGEAQREDGPEDPPLAQTNSPANSSSSSSSSRHSSDYELDDDHGGKQWHEEPDMTDPPPNLYDEAGFPPVSKYFFTFSLPGLGLSDSKFKTGLTGKWMHPRSCKDPHA
jgi:hypothetical protein